MVRAGEVQLAPDPLSVRTARRAVIDSLAGLDADRLDDVLLCTSEVVTNAVEHGAPPIELHVDRDEDHVRVEVSDRSPMRPRVGEPSPEAVRGRGMLIVERCADRWGVDAAAPDGKSVWFEVDLR